MEFKVLVKLTQLEKERRLQNGTDIVFITCKRCKRRRMKYRGLLCHSCYLADYAKKFKINNRMKNQNYRIRAKQNGGTLTKKEWKELCRYYGNKCLACGKPGNYVTLTIDHIVPVSLGGTGDISNIQPLCSSCNSSKGARIIDYRGKNGGTE